VPGAGDCFACSGAAELAIGLAMYVAHRAMLQSALSAKTHLAACVLTAACAKAAFPIVESSAQHNFGGSHIATVALRSDHESLDGADAYVTASTELKPRALDRGGTPNRQEQRCRTSRAVRMAREPSPGRNCVALVRPRPLQLRPDSAEGNTVLRAT
jgi:hypothetical protein